MRKNIAKATPNEVIGFILSNVDTNKDGHCIHLQTCKGGACSCPAVSSLSTLRAYKAAIKAGYSKYPNLLNRAETPEMAAFIHTIKKRMKANRFTPKQAQIFDSTFLQRRISDMEWRLSQMDPGRPQWILHRDLLLVKCLTHFGFRASDALRIKWGDITTLNERELSITLRDVKNLKFGETFKVNLKVADDDLDILHHLEQWSAMSNQHKNPALFVFRQYATKPEGQRPLNIKTLNQFIRNEFGQNFSSHSFRVTKACELKSQGDSSKVIARALRLKTTTMADYYSKQSKK